MPEIFWTLPQAVGPALAALCLVVVVLAGFRLALVRSLTRWREYIVAGALAVVALLCVRAAVWPYGYLSCWCWLRACDWTVALLFALSVASSWRRRASPLR